MNSYHHPQEDFFRKLDVPLPTAEQHGTEDDIESNLKPMKPYKWELKGNELIGIAENGRFAQKIPTDYILVGMDEKNLPILKKVVL